MMDDWISVILVPVLQVVVLGAVVGFPFVIVLLNEVENPK